MPTILGFHDSPFDSGATLIKDGEILAAIHEERIARIKHCGGFPWRSIMEVLSISNVAPSEIDAVALGFTQPDFIVQVLQGFFKSTSDLNPLKSKIDRYKLYTFEKYESVIHKNFLLGKIDTTSSNILLHHTLKKLGIKKKLKELIITYAMHLLHSIHQVLKNVWL